MTRHFLARVTRRYREALAIHISDPSLREMLRYQVTTGGKRLRPLSVFLATRAWNRAISSRHIDWATAVEMIHNATLIHDDIQDGDEMRRGRPTLWKQFSLPAAINAGDALFFLPALLLEKKSPELVAVLQKYSLAVIEGQNLELTFKNRFLKSGKFSRGDYSRIAYGKTTALFLMPILGAALLARVPAVERRRVEKLIEEFGELFQIQDDLIDLWGVKGRATVACDIAEGKLSYPLCLYLSFASPLQKRRLRALFSKTREKIRAQDVVEIVENMERAGVKAAAFRELKARLLRLGSNSSPGIGSKKLAEVFQDLLAEQRSQGKLYL